MSIFVTACRDCDVIKKKLLSPSQEYVSSTVHQIVIQTLAISKACVKKLAGSTLPYRTK